MHSKKNFMFFSLRGSIGEITSIKADGITESRAHGRTDSPGFYYTALLCDVYYLRPKCVN
jgi:hypothetical protein